MAQLLTEASLPIVNPAATAYVAALAGEGKDRIADLTRYRLDGTRCGLAQGRHAAWNWAYRVQIRGHLIASGPYGLSNVDFGRGLAQARTFAARCAGTVVENWHGGKAWERGPKGGLREVHPCPVCGAHHCAEDHDTDEDTAAGMARRAGA